MSDIDPKIGKPIDEKDPLKDVRMKAFLDIIRRLESSDGKNIEHKELSQGIHEGSRAIGDYGLMPQTIKEITNRARQNKTMSSEMDMVSRMPEDTMRSYLESHPETQKEFAEHMRNHLADKYAADEDRMAYAWQHGHNMPSEKQDEKNFSESERVQKYRDESKKMFPMLYKSMDKPEDNFKLPEEVGLDLEKYKKGK